MAFFQALHLRIILNKSHLHKYIRTKNKCGMFSLGEQLVKVQVNVGNFQEREDVRACYGSFSLAQEFKLDDGDDDDVTDI